MMNTDRLATPRNPKKALAQYAPGAHDLAVEVGEKREGKLLLLSKPRSDEGTVDRDPEHDGVDGFEGAPVVPNRAQLTGADRAEREWKEEQDDPIAPQVIGEIHHFPGLERQLEGFGAVADLEGQGGVSGSVWLRPPFS